MDRLKLTLISTALLALCVGGACDDNGGLSQNNDGGVQERPGEDAGRSADPESDAGQPDTPAPEPTPTPAEPSPTPEGEPSAAPEGEPAAEPDGEPEGQPEPSVLPTPLPPVIEWPTTSSAVDTEVLAQLPIVGAPGGAACIVKDGAVMWCDAWGLANVEEDIDATPHTPFMVASVSKALTAVGVMMKAEEGAIDLDTDATLGLPFSVDAPTAAPITWRQLLTHTAGLKDDWTKLDQFYVYPASPTDPSPLPTALGPALESYFSASGEHYGAANFAATGPGTFEYTNMGLALAGFALGVEAEQPFAAWMREHVLLPLSMTRSSFDWAALHDVDVAMPYGANQAAVGYYTFPDTPAGSLRASAYDLARFEAMLMGGGELDGVRLLSENSVASMTTSYATADGDDVGLGLFSYDWMGTWWGHDGAEQGATAQMFWRDDGIGYVLLLNGDQDEEGIAIEAIEDALMAFGETL